MTAGRGAGERGARGRLTIVGGGITGLAAAHHALATDPTVQVVVHEAEQTLGGKIRTSPFAGLPAVDEAADAYLTRVPFAVGLARSLGLAGHLTHPATGSAAVWHDGLRAIPDGLVLGVPGAVWPLLRSGLLSPAGVLRAGLEPLLPRSSIDHDTIGRWVRSRFGDQVHERLLDPLVGSIYAADTDRFSLATVPQLAELATHRSALLAARARRRRMGPDAGPVFEAPVSGMGALIDALRRQIVEWGGELRPGSAVSELMRDGRGYRVDGEATDAVILACPARSAGSLLTTVSPGAADGLRRAETASVVMVAAAVPADQWAGGGRFSGYLVPKPDQHHVTAVSFASNKWAHWRPSDGSMVLRISLGRDGLVVDDWDDDRLIRTSLAEVSGHLGALLRGELAPTELRISRWPGAFPQYRPGHLGRIVEIERLLADDAPGVHLAGASYRGMGIPACVQQGQQMVAPALRSVADVRE